jgi:hypothetical protein
MTGRRRDMGAGGKPPPSAGGPLGSARSGRRPLFAASDATSLAARAALAGASQTISATQLVLLRTSRRGQTPPRAARAAGVSLSGRLLPGLPARLLFRRWPGASPRWSPASRSLCRAAFPTRPASPILPAVSRNCRRERRGRMPQYKSRGATSDYPRPRRHRKPRPGTAVRPQFWAPQE